MQTTRKYRACYFVEVTMLLFCLSVAAAKPQTRSNESVLDAASARIQGFLSDEEAEEPEVIHDIFKFGDKAIPTLVRALQNRKNVERAVWALVYLGGPKERKLLLDEISREKDKEMKLFMSSFLAGALVEPTSEEEWSFLAKCIKGYTDEEEGLATGFAVLALGENGSQRALQILQTVEATKQPQDPDSDVAGVIEEIHRAGRWITQKAANNPGILTEGKSDLEQIKQTVLENAFYAEGERANLSVEDVIFTPGKNRALASVEIYHGPKDAQGYDVVLERHSGKWRIIGIGWTWVA